MTKVDAKKLRNLELDFEKGIFLLNEESIKDSVCELHLDFKDGSWSLMISKDELYKPTTTNNS